MRLTFAMHLRIFIPFAFGYFLSYLYRTVNAVLAPDLMRDLSLEPADLGLLTSAYFLAFAAAQPPLGVLLDRYGPRRVEAILLLIAAAGAMLFALAETLGALLLGRALIGLGVAACLMAAFKSFSQWFPPEQLPFANGIQMVSGGLGALAATTPVELALAVTDWRGIFMGVAVLTLLAATAVLLVVPEHDRTHSGETFAEQLAGLRLVLVSRKFWRITPWAVAAQASYLSLVSLWSGPWLRDVAHFPRPAVARTLMAVAMAMIAGYFALGALAARLYRRGVPTVRVAATGMLLFLVVQLVLAWQPPAYAAWFWILFGFFGTACILPYAVLSQHFPAQLTGRVNTSLNLLVFLGAFAAQWGVGIMVGCWPGPTASDYAADGYRWGILLLVGVQLMGAGWYAFSPRSAVD